jgi:hypothetical protein
MRTMKDMHQIHLRLSVDSLLVIGRAGEVSIAGAATGAGAELAERAVLDLPDPLA